jgi:mono/diheme cytochrome c family protein
VKSAIAACVFAALGFTLSLAGASAGDPKPLPWEKNRLLVGQTLYRNNCVVCHDVDRPQSESKKFGPSFYQLFRRDKMPVAAMKPNRDYIKLRMRFGGALMPAFAKRLNPSEMDLLLDYLQSK